ncbi:MAG: phosphotransferase [Burkholderiales bacterium]|nr:phosphotransferase [Burkholderiales bacterium]
MAPNAPPPFDRARIAAAERALLRDGRFANARVERVRIDGVDWIVKDFASRAFVVRQTVGRLLLGREVRALRRLEGLPGIPSQAFRVDAFAMAARYVPGRTLGRVEIEDGRMSAEFLAALEALLQQVHARGLVHLDTRGGNNLLMRPDGAPGIIDFQAALSTRRMPAALREWFEGLDLGGIYKKWQRFQPDAMGAARRAHFERMNRWRRLWVIRGYFGLRRKVPPRTPD